MSDTTLGAVRPLGGIRLPVWSVAVVLAAFLVIASGLLAPEPAVVGRSEAAIAAERDRLNGLAEFIQQQQALQRARTTDAARWNARADAVLQQRALERARTADAARWNGLADSVLTGGAAELTPGQVADAARPNGLAGGS